MKLYFAPQTRAIRPLIMLEELAVPYEVVLIDFKGGEHKTVEYRKIHPHGQLPALQDGRLTMFESAAICAYLADKFPDKRMAPALGTVERGTYYQWMFYSVAALEGKRARPGEVKGMLPGTRSRAHGPGIYSK